MPCFGCSKGRVDGNFVVCPAPLNWKIEKSLAKRQSVCDDEVTDVVEVVEVLSPLKQKVLISKAAFEKEKDMVNFWCCSEEKK